MLKPSSAVSDGKKPCRQTSAHDRRQACQDLHASRSDDTRRRIARRTPPDIMEKIRALLLAGHTQVEVQDAMRAEGYEMSLGPIGKVAFELESSGLITPFRRKREGMNKGGRPRGEGKKFSPHREMVIAKKLANPSLTSREIGLSLGITRQAVDRILNDMKKLADSDGTPKKYNA